MCRLFAVVVFVVFDVVACAKMVDLTHPFDNNFTVTWPKAPKFNFTVRSRGTNPNGIYYESNDFSQSEHSGTHTDAPAHFFRGAWRIGDIPLERLVGPGVVIDVQERARDDPDTLLNVADLERWESVYGQIPKGSVVIMRSGFGSKYSNRTAYFGWPAGTVASDPTDTDNLHFPGFDPEAVEWLALNRNITGIAVDTASTDRGQSRDFQTHQMLGKYNLWAVENLANADALPLNGTVIYNMVDYLKEGSGAPSRVFALLPDATSSGFRVQGFRAGTVVAVSLCVMALGRAL